MTKSHSFHGLAGSSLLFSFNETVRLEKEVRKCFPVRSYTFQYVTETGFLRMKMKDVNLPESSEFQHLDVTQKLFRDAFMTQAFGLSPRKCAICLNYTK